MNILAYFGKEDHVAIPSQNLGLINGFRELGHNVISVNVMNKEEANNAFAMIRNYEVDLSVGFNGFGCYELRSNIPHVSVMLDEPFNPYAHSIDDLFVRNHIITCLDRSDEKMLDHFLPHNKERNSPPKHKIFMPLGGGGGEALLPQNDGSREYDIVFSSNVWEVPVTPLWHEKNMGINNPRLVKILDEVYELLQIFPINIYTAFCEILKSRGMYDEEYLQRFLPCFWMMLAHIKPLRKLTTLKVLDKLGLCVHVLGSGWNLYPIWGKNITFHGAVSFAKMMDVVSHAKVLVTEQAGFNDGAHDRVFTGMLCGAAVVAEYSSYLDEIFENQREIFMYDWQHTEEHLSVIHRLLSDESYRLSATAQAYAKATENHTWKARAEQILDTVAVLYNK